MVWAAIHHGGGVNWSWWMEPWTGIGTSRSSGIKCCHGRHGCLDVTLCTSKTMPRPLQHLKRQPFWTNRMLRSWTGQFGSNMNPIEHVWDQMSVWIRDMDDPPSIVTELNNAVRQARSEVRPGRVRNLVESMLRRIRALLAARGGHTSH